MLEMKKGAMASAQLGPSSTAVVSGRGRLYSFDPKIGRFQEIEAIED